MTDRQDDQSASQAALDFIRSREVDRVADYMRRGRTHTDDPLKWVSGATTLSRRKPMTAQRERNR